MYQKHEVQGAVKPNNGDGSRHSQSQERTPDKASSPTSFFSETEITIKKKTWPKVRSSEVNVKTQCQTHVGLESRDNNDLTLRPVRSHRQRRASQRPTLRGAPALALAPEAGEYCASTMCPAANKLPISNITYPVSKAWSVYGVGVLDQQLCHPKCFLKRSTIQGHAHLSVFVLRICPPWLTFLNPLCPGSGPTQAASPLGEATGMEPRLPTKGGLVWAVDRVKGNYEVPSVGIKTAPPFLEPEKTRLSGRTLNSLPLPYSSVRSADARSAQPSGQWPVGSHHLAGRRVDRLVLPRNSKNSIWVPLSRHMTRFRRLLMDGWPSFTSGNWAFNVMKAEAKQERKQNRMSRKQRKDTPRLTLSYASRQCRAPGQPLIDSKHASRPASQGYGPTLPCILMSAPDALGSEGQQPVDHLVSNPCRSPSPHNNSDDALVTPPPIWCDKRRDPRDATITTRASARGRNLKPYSINSPPSLIYFSSISRLDLLRLFPGPNMLPVKVQASSLIYLGTHPKSTPITLAKKNEDSIKQPNDVHDPVLDQLHPSGTFHAHTIRKIFDLGAPSCELPVCDSPWLVLL
ncbi:hypothetical protein ACRALDRAFT_206752 [Sodiomyces alcalophilus JCM 7366]|uniref:uncharacterized protein n=1 Tax=Sodiomyces alcalophilus JCM 7366 TaxID=591952 RepID=UPI0039B65EE4